MRDLNISAVVVVDDDGPTLLTSLTHRALVINKKKVVYVSQYLNVLNSFQFLQLDNLFITVLYTYVQTAQS